MKKITLKILSIVLCLSFMMSFATAYAEGERNQEMKNYIVVMEAPALYSANRVVLMSDDDDYRQMLVNLQNEVKAQIPMLMDFHEEEVKSYSYTDVLNGFTIFCSPQTAEYIKTIDGVSSVCEDTIVANVDPCFVDDSSGVFLTEEETTGKISVMNPGNMINAQDAYDKGYDGEGRVIAVIDTRIPPNHSYYKLSDDATVRYTKDDINQIITEKGLKAQNATADNAYRNAKIPFAFDYTSDSPSFLVKNYHGAHVAGIAAGYSTTVSDGIIKGIAPEAQILFFGVAEANGSIKLSTLVAAVEDAVKFTPDAINLSLGTQFASDNYSNGIVHNAYQNAENAGCSISCSAGNADRVTDIPKYIDYGISDSRGYAVSSKVGSVENEYIESFYLTDEAGKKYPVAALGEKTALDAIEAVYCGTGSETEIAEKDLSGKAAIIKKAMIIWKRQFLLLIKHIMPAQRLLY